MSPRRPTGKPLSQSVSTSGAGVADLRGSAILLTIVLALPLAAGIPAPRVGAPVPAATGLVEPLPHDLSDADLVLLLARHAGYHPTPRLLAAPPADATVQDLALKLARRSGAPDATPADFEAFARLDPRVAAPTLTLLAAIDQAWDLRDLATRDVPPEDQRALARLTLDGQRHDPRATALAEPLDRTLLLEAAILLLDTAESLVLPQLDQAADLGLWPADPIADDLGILRIGGTGDDTETQDRLLQIDARGNDTYLNNAGGTTLLADLRPETLDYPIALSVDLRGEDVYLYQGVGFSLGSGFLGVGLLLDVGGNDEYRCARLCQGSGSNGLGYVRDFKGDDSHLAGDTSLGYGTLLGLIRDDGGQDTYRAGAESGGSASATHAMGVLWDREGADAYGTTFSFFHERYGWSSNGGRGYFADEGRAVDWYATAGLGGNGCNNCTWTSGSPAPTGIHGQGNDGLGGLAFIIASQDSQ